MRFAEMPFRGDTRRALLYDGPEPGERMHDQNQSRGRLAAVSLLDMHVAIRPGNLERTELTALALGSLGATNDIIARFTTSRPQTNGRCDTRGDLRIMRDVFDVMGVVMRNSRGRAQATRLAFLRKLYMPDPESANKTEQALAPLSNLMRERFFLLVPLIAEGMEDAEISDLLHIGKSTIVRSLFEMRLQLRLETSSLVLLYGAMGHLPPSREPELEIWDAPEPIASGEQLAG